MRRLTRMCAGGFALDGWPAAQKERRRGEEDASGKGDGAALDPSEVAGGHFLVHDPGRRIVIAQTVLDVLRPFLQGVERR